MYDTSTKLLACMPMCAPMKCHLNSRELPLAKSEISISITFFSLLIFLLITVVAPVVAITNGYFSVIIITNFAK